MHNTETNGINAFIDLVFLFFIYKSVPRKKGNAKLKNYAGIKILFNKR